MTTQPKLDCLLVTYPIESIHQDVFDKLRTNFEVSSANRGNCSDRADVQSPRGSYSLLEMMGAGVPQSTGRLRCLQQKR